ncbi:TolC family outer membrane protein [uncultured Desulfobulbus sp.]|uniref:TolC family outer membrane protein n=1 Tax=uncultured Desulfobulbus sp. TaxID=239745 RepID=UPI0029C71BC9|nr:TolC family outer membrane protein [uncultured Desulfobulbus sp.]
MVLKRFCAILTLALAGGVVAGTVSHAETLQQAVKTMIETNPDVRSVAHNRLARDEEVRQAKANYFPTLDVEAGTGKDYVDKPFDDDLNPQQARIGLRQNLFAGLSTMNEVDRQKARVQSEAFVVRSTADNTALKVVNVYLEVLKNEAIVTLAKENLTLHQRIADQIKLRSESGVDRLADMDQIQSRLNLAQSNLVVAEQNLFDAQTNYNAVVGNPPLQLNRPESPVGMIPATLEDAEQIALAGHPQLKSASADLEARRKQDEVAKSPFMPIIDLEADKIWEEETSFSSYYDGEEREDLRVFLRFRYNLFNGWRDEARKSETVHLINEAQEIKNHTHRQVVESIRLSWQAHEAAKKKTNYLNQRLQFAAKTASAYTKQWNIGQRSLLDVLDAEAERIDSARQLVTAEYEGLYSQYRILNGTGKLVPSLNLLWPTEGSVDNDNNAVTSTAQPTKKS